MTKARLPGGQMDFAHCSSRLKRLIMECRPIRLLRFSDNPPMLNWFRNIIIAVATVWQALWVGLRYWFRTYNPQRRTFTETYEFPERPVPVTPRFRGYHRFDLTTCIACEACPGLSCQLHRNRQEKAPEKKGFQVTEFVIDYGKCLFCALCVEPCPVDCIFMGSSHDFELLLPRWVPGRFFSVARRNCLGQGNTRAVGGRPIQVSATCRAWRSQPVNSSKTLSKRPIHRKIFTPDEANATLPLVRALSRTSSIFPEN